MTLDPGEVFRAFPAQALTLLGRESLSCLG